MLVVVKYDELFLSIQATFQTHVFKISFYQEHSGRKSSQKHMGKNIKTLLFPQFY